MDILRKELEEIYSSQRLGDENLSREVIDSCREMVRNAVMVENDCRVITDASADTAYIYGGYFACLLGLHEGLAPYFTIVDSSDEDEIYDKIHPEDLVEKRMLEYEFFKFVDGLCGEEKQMYKATCRIRLMSRNGVFVYVDNSTRVLQPSPDGKIWLILCTYNLSVDQDVSADITPRIVNGLTGEIIHLSLNERRGTILTEREKEILAFVRDGKLSKQIAEILGISIHTVNRHRQNILEKLSVGNSVEAVEAAVKMRLM